MFIMKKADKTLKQQRRVTIVFGYGLFLITLVMLTVFTIVPWTSLLFGATRNHINTLTILITLVLGAVLPTIVSYVLGDSATHIKNKTSHHYNGVLFGIASYWVALLFTFIRAESLPNGMQGVSEPWYSISSLWPALATIIVMLFVSITYAKNQKNKSSVLQHRPYQVVLVGSALAFLVYIAIVQDYTLSATLTTYSAITLLVPVILVFIGYKILAKSRSSKRVRISEAVIAMTIAGISVSLVARFVGNLNPFITVFGLVVPELVGLCVWVLYLWLVSRRN